METTWNRPLIIKKLCTGEIKGKYMTRYVILTLRTQKFDHDYSEKVFYSAVYGCFSKLRYASTYFAFEDTQTTVKRLRKQLTFVYAIEIPIKMLYECYE